jgi:hypothetical protein
MPNLCLSLFIFFVPELNNFHFRLFKRSHHKFERATLSPSHLTISILNRLNHNFISLVRIVNCLSYTIIERNNFVITFSCILTHTSQTRVCSQTHHNPYISLQP